MSKVLTVVRKEYLERVRSKSFLIGTLLGPVFMGALVLGPALLEELRTHRRHHQARIGNLETEGATIDEQVEKAVMSGGGIPR